MGTLTKGFQREIKAILRHQMEELGVPTLPLLDLGISGAMFIVFSLTEGEVILREVSGDTEGVTGYSRSELEMMDILDALHLKKEQIEEIFYALEINRFVSKTNTITCKDGHRSKIQSIIYPLRGSDYIEITWTKTQTLNL